MLRPLRPNQAIRSKRRRRSSDEAQDLADALAQKGPPMQHGAQMLLAHPVDDTRYRIGIENVLAVGLFD
jgi:hypothetical protein